MKLFGVKTEKTRSGLIQSFLEDNYVSPGYPGIGDLENRGREEIIIKLATAGGYLGQELEEALDSLHIFVNVMQDGDYVLVADEEWVYLGDLGDYFYIGLHDSPEDGTAHRRGVTWLKSLPRPEVNPALEALLSAETSVTQYTGILPTAKVELWLSEQAAGGEETAGSQVKVDEATIAEALAVLKAALQSPEADRRERAAAAILQYAK